MTDAQFDRRRQLSEPIGKLRNKAITLPRSSFESITAGPCVSRSEEQIFDQGISGFGWLKAQGGLGFLYLAPQTHSRLYSIIIHMCMILLYL